MFITNPCFHGIKVFAMQGILYESMLRSSEIQNMLDLRTVIILNIIYNFYILCLQQICVSMEEEYYSAIYDNAIRRSEVRI